MSDFHKNQTAGTTPFNKTNSFYSSNNTESALKEAVHPYDLPSANPADIGHLLVWNPTKNKWEQTSRLAYHRHVAIPEFTTTTASATLALDVDSKMIQVLSGTASDFTVKLPDATTLVVGWLYEVWNKTTKQICIEDGSGTEIYVALPSTYSRLLLTDNATGAGVWDSLSQVAGSLAGGVTPPFSFSRSGGAGVGAYLNVGQVVSSKTGQFIQGLNYLTGVRISTSATQTNVDGTNIQFQRRTGLSTFVDITDAICNIPQGDYKGGNSGLEIPIGPDWELSCYNAGPGNMTDPVAVIFVTPQ